MKKQTRIIFNFLLVMILPLTRSLQEPGLAAYHVNGYAQGTTYSITYYAGKSLFSKHEADSIFQSLDSSLSIYKPYSLITRFNNERRGLRADKHLRTVVKKALEVSRDSHGIFDITVAPLVKAWGFGPAGKKGTVPDSATITQVLQYVGYDKIIIKGDSILKADPRVNIDVNGIAQGYSVDVIAAFLEKKGIRNYLVEVGGELKVKGRKYPGKQLMKIGIEGPSEEEYDEVIVRTIQLKGGAITTSGKYRNFYQNGNKKISHLIDPRSGYYLQNEMVSVTVLAKDAMTADAYDNVLMGMPLDKGFQFLKNRRGLEAYFIYLDKNGKARDSATKNFRALFSN